VASQSFDLDFSKYRPNGPGCGPVCDHARVEWNDVNFD
jgi:hypothetical protein